MWEPDLKVIREKSSDRFHIVNKALDEILAEETRRMKHEGRDPVLKKSRWLLLKCCENLGEKQHFWLRDLLWYNLKTVRPYLLKEALPTPAPRAGLNNKAKATMRKSYGFRTYRALELALYHSPGKLPEPEPTHDFF
jgi:transposase